MLASSCSLDIAIGWASICSHEASIIASVFGLACALESEYCAILPGVGYTLPDAQGQHVWEEVCQVTGRCLCLAAAANEWCSRIQRLFFLNEGFDLTRQDILLHFD